MTHSCSSSPRRPGPRLAGLAATALLASSLAALGSPTAGAAPGFAVERLSGPDRYATAATTALAAYDSASTVLVARGDVVADALASSYLAGDAPLLLTRPDLLPDVTADAVMQLGATRAVVFGGQSAVSPAVVQRLEGLGLEVQRLSGASRFETAAAVARFDTDGDGEIGDDVGEDPEGRPTAVLVNAFGFADALSAGPYAALGDHPVLSTEAGRLNPAASAALQDLGVERVVVAGGGAAVSQQVVDEVTALGVVVERVSGPDRYTTSRRAAELVLAELDEVDGDSVVIARGDNGGGGADALAGVALAAATTSPVVLTSPDSVAAPVEELLEGLSGSLLEGFVLGGERAVTPAVVDAYTTAARGSGDGGGGDVTCEGTEVDPDIPDRAFAQEVVGVSTAAGGVSITVRYSEAVNPPSQPGGGFLAPAVSEEQSGTVANDLVVPPEEITYDGRDVTFRVADATLTDLRSYVRIGFNDEFLPRTTRTDLPAAIGSVPLDVDDPGAGDARTAAADLVCAEVASDGTIRMIFDEDLAYTPVLYFLYDSEGEVIFVGRNSDARVVSTEANVVTLDVTQFTDVDAERARATTYASVLGGDCDGAGENCISQPPLTGPVVLLPEE